MTAGRDSPKASWIVDINDPANAVKLPDIVEATADFGRDPACGLAKKT